MYYTLPLLYFIHIISIAINFYLYHIDNEHITLRDYTILYHALTFYCYIILLFYGLFYVHTMSNYYLVVLLIYYIHICSIIENCYIEKLNTITL